MFSVIAVEPKGKELETSLKAKERLWSNPPQFIDTIAEGIMTQQVSTFQNIYSHPNLNSLFQIVSFSRLVI